MTLLDSRSEIKKYDTHNLLGSVELLPEQIQDAWYKTKDLVFPDSYTQIKNVVISGMGGSALGSLVIKHLFKDELQVPFEVYSHYRLPGYTSHDSLVLLSSYSGTTEETLTAATQAEKVGAKIAVITGGGNLAKLAKEKSWPIYLIDPKYNPSNEPRMAIGYAVAGQLAIFNKLGLINVSEVEINQMVDRLKSLVKTLGPESGISTAKGLAYAAYDKEIVLCAAEHLVGTAHVTNNQLNENAKTLTAEWHLPEFNHHYMEALSNPGKLKEDVLFLLYNSHLYHEKLIKRVELTRQVIENAGYQVEIIQATADSKLEQVFEVITLGAFFNFYLAMLYKIDPAPIPRVDWFKAQMKN